MQLKAYRTLFTTASVTKNIVLMLVLLRGATAVRMQQFVRNCLVLTSLMHLHCVPTKVL